MLILAIDPGPTESAWVRYDSESKRVVSHGKCENNAVRSDVNRWFNREGACWEVVCEMVACYGKPVGVEVFQTCITIGRFMEICCGQMHLLTRADVKKHLCHKVVGVNDSVLRQRLIDIFGPGKDAAIGVKKTPGPLYGIRADEWQALAVAVTFAETRQEVEA